jgi:hypothetical protein
MSVTAISEDFTNGAANFTAVGGTWAASAGTYRVTTPATTGTTHLNTRAIHRTSVDGNFSLAADASTIPAGTPWNDFAVIFGYQDANNYYFFSSNESNDGGTSGLFKVVNGVSTELADVAAPITDGTNYRLRVDRVGGQINAFRNGTLVASATDSTFLSGRVGFGTKSDSAVFDNLVVTQDDPAVSEDFTAGAGGMSAVDGSWGASGGWYRVTAPATTDTTHLNTRAVHSTALVGDFTLDADASVADTASAWNDFAVVFGYQDPSNYYFFSSNESNDAGTNGLFKVVNGVSSEMADASGTITSGATYHVRVEQAGSQIRAYRNGTLVASATDSTFSSGRVGFGTKGDVASFDNLAVTGVADANPTPSPTPPPVAPSGLRATAASSTQVNLTWTDNSTNESGFKVERSTDGVNFAQVATVGAGVTSYAATGLAASTAYTFRVSAYNAAGDSAYSASASATTPAAPSTGAKPGPDNTGVRPGSVLRSSGSITITQGGTATNPVVYENLDVTGRIDIQADYVIIRNTRIKSPNQTYSILVSGGSNDPSRVVIEDTEMSGGIGCGIGGTGFTLRRSEIYGTGADGINPYSDAVIEANWIHGIAVPGLHSAPHADGIQMTKGSNVVIRGNFIDIPIDSGMASSNSAIFLKSDMGPISNITIENNWLNGGNYTIYSLAANGNGAPTGVRVVNNRFGRDYRYALSSFGGPVTTSGNVWDDTGAPAPL